MALCANCDRVTTPCCDSHLPDGTARQGLAIMPDSVREPNSPSISNTNLTTPLF